VGNSQNRNLRKRKLIYIRSL